MRMREIMRESAKLALTEQWDGEEVTPAMRTVIDQATAFATSLGVELDLEPYEGELRVGIWRKEAPPGSGAKVMSLLVRLADEHDVPLMLDVDDANPRLIQYYWQFGFRGFSPDDAKELARFEKFKKKREAFTGDEFGVLIMDRKRYGGPLPGA